MLAKRLIKSNDAGGGACTNTVDLYNPFPDGGGVALYQLNGDATDVSGNYDGTWSGTAAYTTGVFGQSADFNASNYISVPTLSGISQYRFTQSFWMKTTSTAVAYVTSFRSPIYMGFGHKVYTSNYSFLMYDGTTIYNLDITPSVLNDGSWHNVVATYNGSNLILYVDGQFYNSLALSNATPFDGSVNAIGGRASGGYKFTGQVDQVRVFSRALRPYEVEALYTEEYCTPTIVPSEHFNTVLYTGNSSTQDVNVGFAPDLVWAKSRDTGTQWHGLYDTVRGVGESLYSNATNAEEYRNNSLTAFNSNGFSVGDWASINLNGDNYVSWNFKAGGAAVSVPNGIGTSNITQSVNVEAGFSITNYTGSVTGLNKTIPHGLNTAPAMVIIKDRDYDVDWRIWHQGLSGGDYYLTFTTAAEAQGSNVFSSAPTSSVVNLGTISGVGNRTDRYIAYCFAEVEGFSNFGSYVGTGTTEGQLVVTGFEPAFVMVKRTDASGNSWLMVDNKRIGTGNEKHELFADTSSAESGGGYDVAFLENGFQMQTTTSNANASGASYIYMAFAADPTTIEPTLEDSFNTVLYTGNGENTKQITDVGFQPDFLWFKSINDTYNHVLYDSIRGTDNILNSNTTVASEANYNRLRSFDNNGFTLFGNNAGDLDKINRVNVNYVAWAWKGAELPAINSNGSIPSVVSANPAAGFSIVSYTGNGTIGATIGHGLDDTLDVLIVKRRDDAGRWPVWHKDLTSADYSLLLGKTDAETNVPSRFGALPTSSVFTVGDSNFTNAATGLYIAYCFAEVAGFSKFGSYVGNGNVSGPTITTDFEPAFVLIKPSGPPNGAGSWLIYDNKRNTSNPRDKRIFVNNNLGEYTDTNHAVDFNANSFQIIGTDSGANRPGDTFIYMAFANQF